MPPPEQAEHRAVFVTKLDDSIVMITVGFHWRNMSGGATKLLVPQFVIADAKQQYPMLSGASLAVSIYNAPPSPVKPHTMIVSQCFKAEQRNANTACLSRMCCSEMYNQ